MAALCLGIEIRDFDLERMGFALSVQNQSGKPLSEAYLRMTLPELNAFLAALKAATGEISLAPTDAAEIGKPTLSRPARQRDEATADLGGRKLAAAG